MDSANSDNVKQGTYAGGVKMSEKINQVCESEFKKWQGDVTIISIVIADIAHRCENHYGPEFMYQDFCTAIDNALDRLEVNYRDSVNNVRAKHWQKITGGGK